LRLALALRYRLLVRADAFVSMSSELTEEFRAGGVQPDKNHLIPQTVDVARFRPVSPEQKAALRARLGLPPTDRLAIFTGRLVSYKGLPVLVRVWEDICRMHDNARIVVVGSGGVDAFNCEEALHRSVDEHGLAGHVLFTGARSNVEEYLQASDLFVFPTENEAFGISLIEAMACGLPVAAFPVEGPKDVVIQGETGWLDEDLKTAVSKALTMSPQRCREFALQCSWERSVEQFEAILVPIAPRDGRVS